MEDIEYLVKNSIDNVHILRQLRGLLVTLPDSQIFAKRAIANSTLDSYMYRSWQPSAGGSGHGI